MRLFPNHAGANDPDAHAAMFSKDVSVEKNHPNWSHQLLPTIFLLDGSNIDPFDHRPNHETRSDADKRLKVLEQCAGQISRLLRHQHRTAVFQLFVIDGGFRFLRWDRSAVFVTKKMDYLDDPQTLIDFLLGFVILDAENQGMDPTATLLKKFSPEYRLMDKIAKRGSVDDSHPPPVIVSHMEGSSLPDNVPLESVNVPGDGSRDYGTRTADTDGEAVNDNAPSVKDTDDTLATNKRPKEGAYLLDHVLDYFSSSLVDWPRYRLTLNDQIFLVGKPIFESTGLFWRGARGYLAWHVNSNSFVFLKDAWRPLHTTTATEGETLQRLNAARVSNVPTLVCHGFVGKQSTLQWVTDNCTYVDQRMNADQEAKAHTVDRDEAQSKGKKRKAEDPEDSDRHDDEIKPRLRHYAHYRICVKEICLPLKEFKSSKQLITIVRDCIDGK